MKPGKVIKGEAKLSDALAFVRAPHVGATVIFTGPATHNGVKSYPAIVTQVFEGRPFVNLKVLPPVAEIRDEGSVPHEAYESATDRFWAWPA